MANDLVSEATGEMSEEAVIDIVSALPGDAGDRERLLAHEAALRRRADRAYNPEADGTDLAHPAYWRGSDSGVEGAVRIVREALDAPELAGVVGHAGLEQVRRDVAALRASREAERQRADRLDGDLVDTLRTLSRLTGEPICEGVCFWTPGRHLHLEDQRPFSERLSAANARAKEAERKALMAGQDKVAAQRRADSSHRLMENERAARIEAERKVEEFQAAALLGPDSDGITPAMVEREITGLRTSLDTERATRLKAEGERDEAKAPRWLCEGCGWVGTSIQGGGHFRAPDDHCGPCVLLEEGARGLVERLSLAEREREELRAAWVAEDYEIRQILGKALGYPPPPDAQPGDGVVTGPHTGTTLADEAASRLAAAEAEVATLKKVALANQNAALDLTGKLKDAEAEVKRLLARQTADGVTITALRARVQRLEEAATKVLKMVDIWKQCADGSNGRRIVAACDEMREVIDAPAKEQK